MGDTAPAGFRRRRRALGGALGIGAGLALVVAPGPALASDVSVSATTGTLTYTADPGEANDVAISQGGGAIKVVDPGAVISAGAGCQASSDHTVVCSASGVARLAVGASDQDDRVAIKAALPANLGGGSGDDQLKGGSADDKLDGLGGDDTLDPGRGKDIVDGGPGTADTVTYATRSAGVHVTIRDPGNTAAGEANDGEPGEQDDVKASVENVVTGTGDDSLRGPAGIANVLDGGPGVDTVVYGTRTAGVNVTLDGAANDGEPSENDNALAIENITGSQHLDVLIGNDQANLLAAHGGQDFIFGLGGGDRLVGGDGDDGEIAGPGDDVLEGGLGDDSMAGEAGNDTFDGGSGADSVEGGSEADTMTYASRTQRVKVTLDNLPDDGAVGEGDNVRTDVEVVVGGSADDLLVAPLFDASGNSVPGGKTFAGGPGADSLNSVGGGDVLLGGDDADRLLCNSGFCELRGEDGDDSLEGGTFSDSLDGGPGDDTLDGGHGGDDLAGGPDDDLVKFERIGAVTVSLDDVANDIGGGSFDNVHSDIETVVGSLGDDVLVGNDAGNTLLGGAGDDEIKGLWGYDVLHGGRGADDIDGGSGIDTIDAGSEDDAIDALDATADAVPIVCGPGDDSISFDKGLDTPAADCE